MFRTRTESLQTSFLVIAFVVALCAVALTARAQTTVQEPAACSPYRAIPLPLEADKVPVPRTPPGCASYRSYRGIGRPVNYSAARACAWEERLAAQASLGQNEKELTAWIVGGPLILADIYFNGAGVERNIPLALRFACESEEGMVSLALSDIEKLNGSRPAKGPFEFCDYAASTIQMNFCTGYETEIEDDHRNRYYRSLKSSMTVPQQAAFDKLLAAETAFITAHALEVDEGGTIRTLRIIGSQNILNNLFHTEIVHFERKRWPTLSKAQVTRADALVHQEFVRKCEELRRQTKEDISAGAVTADHLSKAEDSWKLYRNAWIAFAQVRYPDEVDVIGAQISMDRYRFLKTVAAYD